ncbi:hypothetical protein PTI98_009334 [Pleurotus ostreatus]|nr:hypothetical protein PTI98_009334 [Pleurotus ostreatus]
MNILSLQQNLANSFGLSSDDDSSPLDSPASSQSLGGRLKDAYDLSPSSSVFSDGGNSLGLVASFQNTFGLISPSLSLSDNDNDDDRLKLVQEFRNKHKPKKSQKPPVWRKDSISSVDTDEDDPSSTFSDFESKGQKDDDYVEPPGAPMGSPQLSPEGEMRAAAGANSIGKCAALTSDRTLTVVPELYLINPLRLVQIRDSLMTLSREQYIDGIAMDQWLLKQYQQLQEPLPRYIPMTYLLCDGPPWGPDEIDGYRRIYDDLPLIEEGPCIMQDCVGVILVNRNHYCCVIFRPEAREIHILGRTGDLMGKRGNWTAIGSQDVWRRVCLLNGWQLGEETMHIKEVGLPQNGYDCGPIVCQAITHMWTERLVFDSNGYWERPALLCCHTTRLTMLRDLQISLVDWITIHAHLQNHYPALIAQYLDLRELVDNLQKSLTPTLLAAVVIPIEQNLLTSMAICAKCKPTRPFHPQRSCRSEQLSKLLKGARRFNPFNNIVSPPAQDEDGDNPSGGEKDDDEFELGRLVAPTEHTPAPLGALIERFPRRVLPVPLTPRPAFPVRLTRKDNLPVLPVPLNRKNNLRGLRLPFDRNFDEYETGPTASALLPVDDTIEGYAPGLVYIAKHILLHGWEHFHDYGWRILPSFAQMFHMTPPTQVGSHIMREVPDDLVQPSCTEPPSGYDVISMGLEDMIAHARTSQEAINIVVTGLDSESRHVHVDITKDQLILGPDDLAVSADIDSVIFVTREPRFMKPVAILTSPVIRDRAPIWKNNHAYAELLVPPSDEDRDAGGARTDWLLQRFALSRVPHVHLGIQGGLSSMVNLYLFFPRMTHKAPYSRFWTSKVPAHIQYLIWEDVILPSLRRVIGVTEEVYAGYDQDHVKFKQGGKSSATPSFPLSRPKFAQFLRELDQMVQCCYEFLSLRLAHAIFQIRALDQEGKTQYGSYFFVLENKGCKSYCRVTYEPEIGMDMEDTVSSAFRKCQETFDGLDWSYMLDPSNGGDLLLDIGVSIHPKRRGVVGLWTLAGLEASYGASGYGAGNIHHVNTMANHGALQSEMGQKRAEQTGIAFRHSYNLWYEVVRKANNSRDLFSDTEVFDRSPKHVDQVKGLVDIFRSSATKKRFGVREEFRVSGAAMAQASKAIKHQARIWQRLGPNFVTWVPSKSFFEFLALRILALDAFHRYVWERMPTNYGTITGVVAFLMQSVVFTPPLTRLFVRQALRDLYFKQNMQRFQMFFLSSLRLNEANCLPEISPFDDLKVHQEMGVSFRRRPPRVQMPQQGNERFPLGRSPGWNEIQQTLLREPWTLLGPFKWPLTLNNILHGLPNSMELRAGYLFTRMTYCTWWFLAEHMVTRLVAPSNVQEALQQWSVTSALETLKLAVCLPNSAGLRGSIPGAKRKPAFQACFNDFFPIRGTEPQTRIWQALAGEVGYLGEYWAQVDSITEDQRAELGMLLAKLLGCCQCLPARKGNELWYTKMQASLGEDAVVLDTNPQFYLLESVGGGGQRGRRQRRKARTLRSSLQFQTHQLEVLHRIPRGTALAAIRRLKSIKNRPRTGRAKNKRVPPKRKTRQVEGIDENQNRINYIDEPEGAAHGESHEQSEVDNLAPEDGSELDSEEDSGSEDSSLWG